MRARGPLAPQRAQRCVERVADEIVEALVASGPGSAVAPWEQRPQVMPLTASATSRGEGSGSTRPSEPTARFKPPRVPLSALTIPSILNGMR